MIFQTMYTHTESHVYMEYKHAWARILLPDRKIGVLMYVHICVSLV